MINILFIHQSADLYGSDKTLLLLLKNINRQRFNPIVILPKEGPLKTELEKENIIVIIAPVLKLYRKMFTPKNIVLFLRQIKSAVKILDALNKEYHFDIIYSNTLAVLLGMIYAQKRKIKHLWHVHEIIVHPKIIAAIFPKILNRYADIIVCNSFATKNNLTKRKSGLEAKTVVIHNGIEPIVSVPDNTSKADFGYSNSDIIITLIGRISRLKGHKLLLSTFINHLSKNRNSKLLFVGSPVDGQEYYLKEIEAIILENQLNDKVKILPFTKNLTSIWAITDIAVMPSTEAESFGLVALEAMLAKKPVVASKHGGLTEIVVNNQTGFLVEANNEKELNSAISKLVENKNLRNSFGTAGYERATSEFSLEKYTSSFEKILQGKVEF